MSSLCFCNLRGEEDFVCICYDSEEEADEEEEESIDEHIEGGETEVGGENVGIYVPSTPSQSCSSTAIAGSSDTGNAKIERLVKGQILNGDSRSREFRNLDLGNGDLLNDNYGDRDNNREQGNENLRNYVNLRNFVDICRSNLSVSKTSSEANGSKEQPSSGLKHGSTSDSQKCVHGDSIANKEQCHFDEDVAKSDPSSSTEYEWQYQEKDGSWVSYDVIKATGGLQSIPRIDTTMSQNIERYRKSRLIPVPIFFLKNHHRCVLDLQGMTEHDTEDGTDRPIRRVPKITPTINKAVKVDLCSALPSYWIPMQGEAPLSTVPLNPTCAEYENLVTLIKQSHPTLRVIQITRIQNLEHYRAYEKRRACLKLRFPDVHFREEVLFHGTNPENVESICKENFNWRLFGTANGHAFGRGAYFTNKATTAACYATLRRLEGNKRYRPADDGPFNNPAWNLLIQPPSRPLFAASPIRGALRPSSSLPPWRALSSSRASPTLRALTTGNALPPSNIVTPPNVFPLPLSTIIPQSNVFPPTSSSPKSSAFPNSSAKVIFIVQVLIGRYMIGFSNSDKPSDNKHELPYDTTVDNLSDPTIFVKYNSEEYYPQYFIEFE